MEIDHNLILRQPFLLGVSVPQPPLRSLDTPGLPLSHRSRAADRLTLQRDLVLFLSNQGLVFTTSVKDELPNKSLVQPAFFPLSLCQMRTLIF